MIHIRTASPILLLACLVWAAAGCATKSGPLDAMGDPEVAERYELGVASYYASKFHGRRTANGEVYDEGALTCAHPTLSFGTRVRVTNLVNDRFVVLRINDRGPFIDKRIIDVSRRAARELGFLVQGTTRVRIDVLGD